MAVRGDIVLAGSSTIFPLAESIAARFKKEGYKGSLSIASIGSVAGRARYIHAEVDIAFSSSAITQAELTQASKNRLTTLELRIGTDALVICVNKSNTFVKNLSLPELARAFTVEHWSDVNPAWPKKKILRFIPGTDSGTFDYFVETVLAKKKEALLNASNTQKSENDNVLVRGIEGSPYALGFFGYSYYLKAKDRLSTLSVNNVLPSQSTVTQNSYPLSRPLYLYVARETLRTKAQIAAFINYFLTYVHQDATRLGFFPLPPLQVRASKKKWLDALVGLVN